VILYRRKNPEAQLGSNFVQLFIFIIRLIVTFVVLGIWTVIGFVLWIPLLTRMIAYFSGIVVTSAFSRKVSTDEAQKHLNFAIEFYVYGYKKVLEVLQRDDDEIESQSPTPIDLWELVKTVLVDIIWTLMFWSGIVFLLF